MSKLTARIRSFFQPDLQRGTEAAEQPSQELAVGEATASAPKLDQVFVVIEVDNAEPLVGHVFRRRFHTEYFPEEPRHFVALALLENGTSLPLGYVHYTMWEGCALCGGLVIDNRHYRQLPVPFRKVIQAHGGIAEMLLRESFARLPNDIVAIWGHVGDHQSEKVTYRVGFRRVDSPYLMVVWRDSDLTAEEKTDWVQRAEALGPF